MNEIHYSKARRMRPSKHKPMKSAIPEHRNYYYEKMATTYCNICFKPLRKKEDRKVDHCHNTGEIRGTLCASCNGLLGCANDNPKILMSAIKYLTMGQQKRIQEELNIKVPIPTCKYCGLRIHKPDHKCAEKYRRIGFRSWEEIKGRPSAI